MSISTKTSRLGRALALGLTAALIGGASLLGATSAQAIDARYTISGDAGAVTAADGATPLAGVEVSVSFTEPGESGSTYATHSNDDGSFAFESDQTFPVGDYDVKFVLAGHDDKVVPVSVVDADVIMAPVTLVATPPALPAGTVSISGTPVVGNVLTAETAGWPVGTTFSYDWGYSRGQSGNPTGVTTRTYTVTSDLIGTWVLVNVTGTLAGYTPTTVSTFLETATSAPKKPTGAAPADTTGSTPAAQTSAGLPAGPLDPGVDHTANVNWAGADSYVDVYVFSTPTLVGTFPVVNGVAQITLSKAVLAKLSTGTHTLVITGQTSGAVQSVTLALGLAATGAENPAVPVTVASLLLLLGAGLLIGRRRLAQKA